MPGIFLFSSPGPGQNQIGYIGILLLLFVFFFFRYRTRLLKQKIAEQKKAQETLIESRDLAEFRRAEIEKLVAAISSLLIAVDSDGKIFQWNETAENFFNIPAKMSMGQYFTDVLKDYIHPGKLTDILEKGLAGKEGKYVNNFEISIDLKDKGIRLLLTIINPITDSNGKRLGFLLLAENITHHKEEECRRNLSQKLELLGQMAGNIAHEIKIPLQYIGHNSQFVCESFTNITQFYETVFACLPEMEQSNKKDAAQKIREIIKRCDIEYLLREIPQACNQMADGVATICSIIHSMKEYSHPGRGVMEKADINKLLCTTIVIVQNKINKALNIKTKYNEELPKISCYPGELNQVFMNLMGNALDAIQEKNNPEEPGIIKITSTLKDNEIIVTIADNGCGIPDNIKDNVFNPFFTTKEIGKGTGQGLSMAHNIVEKHKGKIYFKSKAGEGTTFYIHLPIEGEIDAYE
jgi:PAS domain S-box-containing protein